MKHIIFLFFFFSYFIAFSQNSAECDTYYEYVVKKEDPNWQIFYSHKRMPKYIKKIFEEQIENQKIDFTNYSDLHKYDWLSKKKRLVFLYCSVKSNDIVISVYNKEGIASAGLNYFFSIDNDRKITKLCVIRLSMMICDPWHLATIVKNKNYHLKISEEVLNKMN